MELTRPLLNSYLGMHIKDICLNQFDGNEYNHCAHFVGHVLRVGHGKTCRRMVHRSHHLIDGASILVDDLFDVSPNTRELLECSTTGEGLIYVSAPTSFEQIGSNVHRIKSVKKRHVGVYLDGTVWHYSNSQRKVVWQPVADFFNHYRRQQNALWLGDIVSSARPISFGISS